MIDGSLSGCLGGCVGRGGGKGKRCSCVVILECLLRCERSVTVFEAWDADFGAGRIGSLSVCFSRFTSCDWSDCRLLRLDHSSRPFHTIVLALSNGRPTMPYPTPAKIPVITMTKACTTLPVQPRGTRSFSSIPSMSMLNPKSWVRFLSFAWNRSTALPARLASDRDSSNMEKKTANPRESRRRVNWNKDPVDRNQYRMKRNGDSLKGMVVVSHFGKRASTATCLQPFHSTVLGVADLAASTARTLSNGEEIKDCAAPAVAPEMKGI